MEIRRRTRETSAMRRNRFPTEFRGNRLKAGEKPNGQWRTRFSMKLYPSGISVDEVKIFEK
ncbi:unnamed protein product [Nesidiocoris tenuis]|uniref:Uncharacterized protein n=1 Tax=Nesidiocoris tenuis TaxID=355587 RepID=A0A6H5GK75_9HEMI|nr:unnamed protein product [Nesidiocoris tenuis]